MAWSKGMDRSLKRFLTAVICLTLCITVGCKKEEQKNLDKEGFCTDISGFNTAEASFDFRIGYEKASG